MKPYLLLVLMSPLLLGCPINERGLFTKWWNGEDFTAYYSQDGRLFWDKKKRDYYEKLSQNEKELINKNETICRKKHLTDKYIEEQINAYHQCLEELNTPKYFNSKTGKYERF